MFCYSFLFFFFLVQNIFFFNISKITTYLVFYLIAIIFYLSFCPSIYIYICLFRISVFGPFNDCFCFIFYFIICQAYLYINTRLFSSSSMHFLFPFVVCIHICILRKFLLCFYLNNFKFSCSTSVIIKHTPFLVS